MIILTPSQANEVRGLTVAGHALAPVLLANGNFVLPDAVLSDPYHAVRHSYLQSNGTVVPDEDIKQGTPSDPGNPNSPKIGSDYEQDPAKTSLYTYSKEWSVGELVVVAAPEEM